MRRILSGFADSRQTRGAYGFEQLEVRLPLSHSPLTVEAPEFSAGKLEFFNRAPLVADFASPLEGASQGTSIISIAAEGMATSEVVIHRPISPAAPSGEAVLSKPLERFVGNVEPLSLVTPTLRLTTLAESKLEVGTSRPFSVLGEMSTFVRVTTDAEPVEFHREFFESFRLRPILSERLTLEHFEVHTVKWDADAEAEPIKGVTTPSLFRLVSGDFADHSPALSNVVITSAGYTSGAPPLALPGLVTNSESRLLTMPERLSESARENIGGETAELSKIPAEKDRRSPAFDPTQFSNAFATAMTAAKTFLADFYQAPTMVAPRQLLDRVSLDAVVLDAVLLDTVLLETVALNKAALDEALEDIVREVDGLGCELLSFVDEIRFSPAGIAVVAAAATGLGGVLVRRYRSRQVSERTPVEDSSSWLFARLQDPSDA